MTTTDTDALTKRINDAFLSEGPWRSAVEAAMRHEGYTEEEIAEAYGPVVHTDECTDNGYPFGYDCTDEEGRDQHPLHTRSRELDDIYRLFFEESNLAAAVLPIVAEEVRKAKAEALREVAGDIVWSAETLPHMTPHDAARGLVRRADRIEAGDSDEHR